ncbi:MAG TPA: DM13 domain-containing protein, partial [Gemmatimonadales bacterium]|nr:DM13 domain-containing protein [Gemmatimonadales bacterium]
MTRASHWPEYAIEAGLLGLFMVSACAFTVLLEHPRSPVHPAIPDPILRRALMGLAMGGTAIALIYSPWGMRSGAHFNPATTLTFFRLGRVPRQDAVAYVGAQFLGGALGVLLASLALGGLIADRTTRFAATLPGPAGAPAAFAAELVITFVLMSVILHVSNHPTRAHLTGLCAGALVALYIIVEAPLSGMSMNPARTLASALFARDWTALWVYFTAPPLGMLLAAELYVRRRGNAAVFCAKLHHRNEQRCIFCEARCSSSANGTFLRQPSLYPPSRHRHAATYKERGMTRRIWVAGLVVVGAIGWYLFRPELLFVKTRVNESLPTAAAAQMAPTAGAEKAGAGVLLAGMFHSVAHETRGSATVHDLGDGRRVVRFTDFATSNGPDVRVYLVAAADASDNETVTKAGFVELGRLKGTEGDQNYEIPAGLDLGKYRAV